MSYKRLRQKLLSNYNKNIRPVQSGGNMTVINITLAVLHSFDLIEENETLVLDGFIRLKWLDSRWKWNPSEFGGIDFFSMGVDEVWLPDISVYESIPAEKVRSLLMTRPMLYPSGKVTWSPRVIYQSHCPLTFDNYPDTIQVCNITFGSWTQDGISVDLKIEYPYIYTNVMAKNHKWRFLNYSSSRLIKYRNMMPNPFVNVVYSLQFQRLPSGFQKIVKPSIIVAMVSMLLMFWLPPSADKKLTLGTVSLFILMILLLYVSALKMPPLAFNFYVSPVRSVIYIVVSAILSEILVLIVTKLTIRPPEIITNLLRGSLSKILFLYSEETNLVHMWMDDKLKWNPEDYGDIMWTHLGPDEAWNPNIVVVNWYKDLFS
ncbi:acetylcholine receptor subunit alpha-like [Centruroides sculpturatus]|uniref:acetylcholine receptor subunit alpha-like n=1 Tax=Centruroides sculpturatus TaxID=218467 RepID=UPI000C6D3D38|nr:acetylcholine receptor subunit alpha-like [Centruroides sculpturatus]